MKKLFRFLALITTCCLLFTGCATKIQQPLALDEPDLIVAADILYGKLCLSGKLDEIAAMYEDYKPLVNAAAADTRNLDSRNFDLDADIFSQRIVDKLAEGNHMVYTAETRSAVTTGILVGGGKISEGGKNLPDFELQCEIRSSESYRNDRYEIRYTFSAILFDLHENGEQVWKASHRMTRIYEN